MVEKRKMVYLASHIVYYRGGGGIRGFQLLVVPIYFKFSSCDNPNLLNHVTAKYVTMYLIITEILTKNRK